MTKAADAIGLAALRAPGPFRPAPGAPARPPAKKPRRRRVRLRFGRMMFAGVVVYLIGAGAVGELQLLQVQAQTKVVTRQLRVTQHENQALQKQIQYLRSRAGQAQAVRQELHYAKAGALPIVVKPAP